MSSALTSSLADPAILSRDLSLSNCLPMSPRIINAGKSRARVPSRVIADTHSSIGMEMHSSGGKNPGNTSPTSSEYFLFTCSFCGEITETRMVTKTAAIDEGRDHRACIYCGAKFRSPKTPQPLSDHLKAQVVRDSTLTPVDYLVTGMKELRLWKCDCKIKDGSSTQPFIYSATVAARTNALSHQDCPRCSAGKTLDQIRNASEKRELEGYLSTLAKTKVNQGYLSKEILAKFPLDHKAHFRCKEGHLRYSSLLQMVNKGGCLTCYTKERIGLTLADNEYSHLHDEFVCVPDYPTFKMQDVPAGSRILAIEWACKSNPLTHRWKSYAFRRTKEGKGCPYCAGKSLASGDSLADRYPDIAMEFDSADNVSGKDSIPITSAQVRYDLAKTYAFICGAGHKFKASVRERSLGGSNCPSCELQSRSISSLRPDLAAQWHTDLNCKDFPKLSPESLSLASNKKVWWLCTKNQDHIWLAEVKNRARTKTAKCPLCMTSKLVQTNASVVADFQHLASIFDEQTNKVPASQAPLIMRRNYHWRCLQCSKTFQRRLFAMLSRHTLCGNC